MSNRGDKAFVPQIPYGTRDFLPQEAWRKRQTENLLAEVFGNWGYDEVVTPTYEYLSVFGEGGLDAVDQVFKFFDRSNRTLVLRPDMTTPIARLAATRFREETGPLRFFYLTNVFRYEDAQAGRQCEFYQAGVELLGAADAAADAEIIALAIQALRAAGLQSFQISIGQADFLRSLTGEIGLNDRQAEELRHLLVAKDMVGLTALLEEATLPQNEKDRVKRVLLTNGREELLHEAKLLATSETSRRAIENLEEVYSLLQAYEVADFVAFDLGLVRDFDYYTGMVFEGYTPGLGFPVCGGGRYDRLLEAFGQPRPATGFALGVDRLLMALEKQAPRAAQKPIPVIIAWEKGAQGKAIAMANDMRKKGEYVLVETEATACGKTKNQQGFAAERYIFVGK